MSSTLDEKVEIYKKEIRACFKGLNLSNEEKSYLYATTKTMRRQIFRRMPSPTPEIYWKEFIQTLCILTGGMRETKEST